MLIRLLSKCHCPSSIPACCFRLFMVTQSPCRGLRRMPLRRNGNRNCPGPRTKPVMLPLSDAVPRRSRSTPFLWSVGREPLRGMVWFPQANRCVFGPGSRHRKKYGKHFKCRYAHCEEMFTLRKDACRHEETATKHKEERMDAAVSSGADRALTRSDGDSSTRSPEGIHCSVPGCKYSQQSFTRPDNKRRHMRNVHKQES